MADEENEERLEPLTVYLVHEEAEIIRALADDAGVSVSHYLRQKLKRLLPLDVASNNINAFDPAKQPYGQSQETTKVSAPGAWRT